MSTDQKMLQLCAALIASVSADNLAKRGDRLHSTLVDPFAIRELADLVEELAPGAVAKIREYAAERRALAAQARAEIVRARAVQIDAERRAQPVDPEPRRALPKYR